MKKRATLFIQHVTAGSVTLENLKVEGPPEHLGGVLSALLYVGVEPTVDEETET